MKNGRWLYVFCGLVLSIGIIGSIWAMKKPKTDYVWIIRNGETLYQFDLTQTEDQKIEIEYGGKINVVEIKGHRIRMVDAECPDRTCVQMGWLDSSVPIVCLPNHLVIQFLDMDADMDAKTY